MNPGELHFRPLISILCDAIRFAELAEDLDPKVTNPPSDYDYFTFARASVLNSAFLVECAINASIDQTDQSRRQKKKLQDAPVIKKYELLLPMLKPGMKLDTGLELVKMVQELVYIRNTYAHAKTVTEEAAILAASSAGGTFRMNPVQCPLTKIPKTLERCSHEDAVNALRVSTTFISWYFCALCKLSDIELNHSLKSVIALNSGYASLVEDPHKPLLTRAKERFAITIAFLPEFR